MRTLYIALLLLLPFLCNAQRSKKVSKTGKKTKVAVTHRKPQPKHVPRGSNLVVQKPVATQSGQPYAGMWRKKVERRINMPASRVANAVKVKRKPGRPLFWEYVTEAVLKDSTKAFFDLNGWFTATNKDDIIRWTRQIDTSFIDNTEKQEQVVKIDTTLFYDQIVSFRILEEWSFNLQKGITEIRISAIAPQMEVRGDGGDFRGYRTLFWMHWADFQRLLTKYQAIDTANRIDALIWAEYFKDSSVSPDTSLCMLNSEIGMVWNGSCLRNIEIYRRPWSLNMPFPEPTNLKPYDEEMLLAKELFLSAQNGSVVAYNDACLDLSFLIAALKEKTKPTIDSIIVVDPLTGEEKLQVMRTEFPFERLTRASIKEEWKFDAKAGVTEINYRSIGLIFEQLGDAGNLLGHVPFFWLRYSDARKELNRYAEYNPSKSIDWLLWDVRFKEKRRRPVWGY